MNLLETSRELAALAQTGLHFTNEPYDRERYERLREIAVELLAFQSTETSTRILEWQLSDFGYATPKVDVRAFIHDNDKVFLIREDHDHGRWTLPGGWADINTSPSENVIREVKEESGYDVNVKGLLAVYDRDKQGHTPAYPFHIYKMFFHCEIVGGNATPNYESSECGYFSIEELPELSVGRVLEHQLREFLETCLTAAPYQTKFD